MLIDTGGHLFMDKEYTDRRDELVNALLERGVNDTNLELILLTHGDNDHVCNAKYIRERFHSKIAMHSGDGFMVEKKDNTMYRLNAKYKSLLFCFAFWLMSRITSYNVCYTKLLRCR